MNEQDYDPTRDAPPAIRTEARPTGDAAVLHGLTTAMLSEFRARRRWNIFFRLCWLVLIAGACLTIFGATNGKHEATGGAYRHVARIDIDGVIAADAEASAANIIKALDHAFESSQSTGVILSINSPGGSPVQAAQIYDEILRLRKKHPDKHVYAVAGDMCTSAAYYIASAAEKVVVNKLSLVGSIGVLMSSFGATGLMDKIGVERRLYTAGANKGILDPFSPVTDEQRKFVQAALDNIHLQFIRAVREGRGNRLKENPQLFSGLFWTGDQSVEMGLADSFGSVDSVARDVFKTTNIVDYSESESFPDRLARKFGAKAGGSLGTVAGHAFNAALQTQEAAVR